MENFRVSACTEKFFVSGGRALRASRGYYRFSSKPVLACDCNSSFSFITEIDLQSGNLSSGIEQLNYRGEMLSRFYCTASRAY